MENPLFSQKMRRYNSCVPRDLRLAIPLGNACASALISRLVLRFWAQHLDETKNTHVLCFVLQNFEILVYCNRPIALIKNCNTYFSKIRRLVSPALIIMLLRSVERRRLHSGMGFVQSESSYSICNLWIETGNGPCKDRNEWKPWNKRIPILQKPSNTRRLISSPHRGYFLSFFRSLFRPINKVPWSFLLFGCVLPIYTGRKHGHDEKELFFWNKDRIMKRTFPDEKGDIEKDGYDQRSYEKTILLWMEQSAQSPGDLFSEVLGTQLCECCVDWFSVMMEKGRSKEEIEDPIYVSERFSICSEIWNPKWGDSNAHAKLMVTLSNSGLVDGELIP